ncbi:MAG TPA: right-handed parallel beta-helix repeat-containing protein, partial [Pyrinomonadaceae bacterium]
AIVNSGLQEFYLEALAFDPAPTQPTGLGHWRLVYGARVTLNSATGVFSLPDPLVANSGHLFGAGIPPSSASFFFRLWNGVESIADFDGPAPLPLQDGILLQFDPAAGANYVAGDYWTFSVRAGEIDNEPPLVDDQPPEGIHYHRVPLGILQWQAPVTPPLIEDCRHVFQPLTKLATCCTYRVGDGTRSHGDFTSIQAAVDALPAAGGEVCVLPGVYVENVRIERRRNVTIKGCGPRSRVVSPPGANNLPAAPVFFVTESQDIEILSLAVEAHDTGIGILLDGRRVIPAPDQEQRVRAPLFNVTLEELLVRAATRCAIEAHDANFTTVRRCHVEMKDVPTSFPAVFFIGDDGLIEDNLILVITNIINRPVVAFQPQAPVQSFLLGRAEAALGGLQLGGGCERVRVLDNVIARGIGIGIKLGSLVVVNSDGEPLPEQPDPDPDPCFPCRPGDNTVPGGDPDGTSRTVSEGDLHEIEITGNRIYRMGLDGIGVAGFFPLGQIDEFISVHGLRIISNEIRLCLYRPLLPIPDAMLDAMGYGGISLADVSDLVIRDNFIHDNSPDFSEPVCGIFVLHGEALEISRNHIFDNGTRPVILRQTNAALKRGPRGGIHIRFAIAPVVPINFVLGRLNFTGTAQSGIPALRVHDNVVSVPVAGRALTVTALGAVSVVGNQFSTRGVGLIGVDTFDGSTVWIMNLGISNEFFLQLLIFLLILIGNNQPPGGGRPGLDDATIGRSLIGGNVLFAANQCTLDLMQAGASFTDTSIFIGTLDDLGFHDNQCECNLLDDFVLAQAVLFAISVRASDNRFKENMSLDGERFTSLFSAITLGIFNTTTDNQSTRCLFIIGFPNLTVDHSNVSLLMLSNPNACCNFLVNRENCVSRGAATVNPVNPPPNQAVTTVTLARG